MNLTNLIQMTVAIIFVGSLVLWSVKEIISALFF